MTSAAVLAASPAFAIDRDACAIPYEQAQVLRKQRIFSAAREQLEICRTKCPPVLSADCSQWEAELKALTPTVVFRVHDPAGRRLESFRATDNGTIIGGATGDAQVAVDPGDHAFRFEAPGYAAGEIRVSLNEGEHGRGVDVTLVAVAPPPGSPGIDTDTAPSRGLAYVLVGIGALGLASGGALALAGFVDKANLQNSCAPACHPDSVDTIRTLWTVGAVSAATGAAAAGVGITLWVRSGRHADAAHAWWAPVVGPRAVGIVGAF
jgi:hypothetical protein